MKCKQFPNKDKGENNQDLQVRGDIFLGQKLPQVILRDTSIICRWHVSQVPRGLASPLLSFSRYVLNILGEVFCI